MRRSNIHFCYWSYRIYILLAGCWCLALFLIYRNLSSLLIILPNAFFVWARSNFQFIRCLYFFFLRIFLIIVAAQISAQSTIACLPNIIFLGLFLTNFWIINHFKSWSGFLRALSRFHVWTLFLFDFLNFIHHWCSIILDLAMLIWNLLNRTVLLVFWLLNAAV